MFTMTFPVIFLCTLMSPLLLNKAKEDSLYPTLWGLHHVQSPEGITHQDSSTMVSTDYLAGKALVKEPSQPSYVAPSQVPPSLPETYTERCQTVSALWKGINKEQVVHIRGTPASGKSTLAYLLARHVSQVEPDMVVHNLRCPARVEGLSTVSRYHRLLNKLTGRPPGVCHTGFRVSVMI